MTVFIAALELWIFVQISMQIFYWTERALRALLLTDKRKATTPREVR